MQVLRDVPGLRSTIAAARGAGRRIHFVPTMGALHAGHASLIQQALRPAAPASLRPFVVVSIFVNPTQFGPQEDFARYPRDEAGDLALCRGIGVDVAFLPTVPDMYPAGAVTTIRVAKLTDTLCGPWRPGHFDGVATVVAKFFNLVQPDAAFFGEKDAQQLAVIRRMVRDLDFPIEIIGCPTVREPDGLALSSRNRYLSPDERSRALALSAALRRAEELVASGRHDAATIQREMETLIAAAKPTQIDYVSIVDAETLQPIERITAPALAAVAVRFGQTRLIDNVTLRGIAE